MRHVPRQTLRHAWWPTARSIAWPTPLAAAALAVALVIEHRLVQPSADAGSFTVRAQMVAALAAAAAATVLNDPAANLLDSSPTTRARRTGLRLAQALVVWAATWTLTLALIATAPGSPPVAELTVQALVLVAVAAGAALTGGATAGAATVGLLTFSAFLVPERWSLLSGDPAANRRLGLLGLVGAAAGVWASRDRARRHRAAWPIRPR